MLRRLFAVLSALSLVLCVTTIVLYARGQIRERSDEVTVTTGTEVYALYSYKRRVYVGVFWNPARPPPPSVGSQWLSVRSDPAAKRAFYAWLVMSEFGHRWGGFGAAVNARAGSARLPYAREVVVPHWFIVLATAVLPLLWATRHIRRSRMSACRAEAGLCLTCGYDLRGTPDRCPECGAVPAGSAREAGL